MNSKQIISTLEELKFPKEEIDQWKIITPNLTDTERQQLGETLEQYKQEGDILAIRQANDYAGILSAWQSEHS